MDLHFYPSLLNLIISNKKNIMKMILKDLMVKRENKNMTCAITRFR